ncbi:MAG TPA: hypothetical protein VJZ71_12280 [Phycisphaerae bacterium]|nr:hypothetical protein [Phycisphaerae bacterium]
MRRSFSSLGAAVIVVMLLVSPAAAELLGVLPGFPTLTYDSNGTTSYNSTTDTMSLIASPIAIRFTPSSAPHLVMPTGSPAQEVLQLGGFINDTGGVAGGVSGDDLIVIGEVDGDDPDTLPDYSGVLLTGEILQFGFEDTGTSTDRYDFRFALTGGQLASFFSGMDIGVVVTSENSNFVDSFTVDFIGGAKGALGPIEVPEPATLGLILMAGLSLARPLRRR